MEADAPRMRALVVEALEGPDGLALARTAAPAGGDGVVVIEVHAAGVGPYDLLVTEGRDGGRREPPFVPGREVAGLVRSAPAGSCLVPGDRAAAFAAAGGFAEMIAVPAAQAVALPDDVDFETAAGLVVDYHTAHAALEGLRPGETLVVHGGAGGIGTAAIQVGRALGARVLATARGEDGLAAAADAGADEVLELAGGWPDRLRSLLGEAGAGVIADAAGGTVLRQSRPCLAPEGRLLTLDAAWSALLARDPGLLRRTHEALLRMLRAGFVAPSIGARYPLEEGAQALRDLASRRVRGKPVITVRTSAASP